MKYKSIDIINFWHTNNYGANLTAFALQNVLQQLGFENELVNNSLNINEIRLKKCFGFDFQKQHLITTKPVAQSADVLNSYCEIFITGSDQVFRPIYTQNKLEQYMLDFATPNKKKIAFSASFGVDKEQFIKENPPEIIEHMKNSLKSFDFISVREKSGVEICRDLYDIDAEWIIDPVFILDKSKYDELIENDDKKILKQVQNDNNTIYTDKIVAYVLDTSKEYKKAYKYLSKKYNKKVVETANSNISVESWLKSIRDCELFITDSFHGMCFALIFNKPLICLANKSRGRARFDSICEMLGVKNQCIESISEVLQKDCVFKVDYDKVNQRIAVERQRGLDFSKMVLETPVKIKQEKIDVRMKYLENRVVELERNINITFVLKQKIWNLWKKFFYSLPVSIQEIIRKIRGR